MAPPPPHSRGASARRAASERPQPLYTPRSPPPTRWRPSRLTRWLLGVVPGVRAMALDDLRRGLPYAAMGLIVALAFALVAAGWSSSRGALARLRIEASLELVDAASLLLLAVAYEGLRLASALEERRRRPAAPRVVATLFVPAALLVALLPALVAHGPRLLEPLWWTSLTLAVGSSAAVVWCLFEDTLHTAAARRRIVLAWGAGAGALLACFVFSSVLMPGLAADWAAAAQAAGFRLLPALLAGPG